MRIPILRGFIPACLLLLGAGAARSQSAYFQAVTNLNPAAYWPLQETVQPPVADVETNLGALGAIANAYYSCEGGTNTAKGASGAIAGDPDPSVDFPGNNQSFMIVPTTDNRVSLPAGQPFTVEAWAFSQANNQGTALISQTGPLGAGGNNAGPNSAGWSLSQNWLPYKGTAVGSNSLDGWSFHVFNGVGSTGGAEADAAYSFANNTWYHIVGVFDGVNCAVYVNGTNATTYQIAMTGSYVPDTWDPIEMGCNRGLGANPYHGALDEMAIYTNALTANQVSNHYSAGTSGFGTYQATIQGDNPYMYWRMDAPAYTAPSSGYPVAANYGSLASSMNNLNTGAGGASASVYQPGSVPGVAGPAYAGFGAPSYACAFNGLGGAVDAGYAAALDPLGNTNQFTLTGWFKGNPTDNNGRFNSLASHSDSSWRFKINNGATRWNYGGSGAGDLTGPAINVNDGSWHMFAGVYNPTNSSIYIDGTLSTSANNNQNITGKPALDVFLGGAPDYLSTANNNNNYNTGQQFFAGQLAHVAYFTNALTPAQISGLYSTAVPNVRPTIVAQPVAGVRTNNAGASFLFFGVLATGTSPLAYQWYLTNVNGTVALVDDGVKYAGSAAFQVAVSNLAATDSGSYFVVITNNYGAATSALSGLVVVSTPVVSAQNPSGPFGLFVNQNYNLSVTAAGPSPLYQWITNGVADTTAGKSASYALTGVQLSLSGETFQCVVTNSFGSVTSLVATLTVNPLPSSITGSAYASSILALNPSGYWPMHEVETAAPAYIETNYGSLASLGNGYYADWVTPIVTHQVPGALAGDSDPAAEFYNTGGDCVIIPHTSPLSTIRAPYTLETWVKPIANNTDGTSYGVIIGQGGSTGLNKSANLAGFALQYSGTPNTFSLVIWNGTNGNDYEQKTTASYPPGQWYHLVATFDGTNVAYWVNGVQAQFGTLQAGGPSPMAPDSWSPLCIGAGRWSATGASQPFAGLIDEVAVYTNLLSQTEIEKHYSDGASGGAGVYKADVLGDNPLLYYRMDAPAYTKPPTNTWPVLTNYGSVAINGFYTPGTAPGSVSGPNENGQSVANFSGAKAYFGNGVNMYADAGTAPTLNPSNYTSFSYTAWFKGNPGDDRSFQGIMSANDNTWRCSINQTGNVQAHGNADLVSPTVYNDGNWHQFVLTAQAAATNYTNNLYVDGQLVKSSVANGTNNPGATSQPYPEVLIGNETGYTNNPVGPGRCLAGSVCEAAFFYGTVLSASQVQSLYTSAGVPPYITQQPVSGNVNQNGAFTNTVAVNGSGPFSYQWYFNGGALANQTNSSLVLNPVLAGNAGSNYYAVVSNSYGSVTSTVVSLSVNTSPVILGRQPAESNLTLFAGVNLTFSVSAGGARPLSYYWYSNNLVVAGATNSTYTITNLQPGSFTTSGLVSNFLGTIPTAPWTVSVVAAPSAPYPQSVLALNPFGYWRLNEPDDGLSDGNDGVVCHDYVNGNNGIYTNTILGQPGYNAADSADSIFDPETSAAFGSVPANSCAFNIPGIDVSAGPGTNAAFTVEAWANGLGQTGNTPGIVGKGIYYSEEFTIDTGVSGEKYRFEVRDAAGNAYNANSTLIANDNLWHHLVGVCDEAHSNIWLYIDGTNAASVPIAPGAGIVATGATTPMSIGARSSVGTSFDEQFLGYINDVAFYKYALSPGQIASNYLASGIAPAITLQPVSNTNVDANSTLTVSAAASGTAPLSYQWIDQNTGQPAPGATNATLVINNISGNDSYYLQVTNSYGAANSQSVSVNVVGGPPTIEQDITPAAVTLVAGSSVSFSVGVNGTLPFTYGWQHNSLPVANGGRISGANSSVLTISPIQASDAGTYQLFVTNGPGNAQSSQAILTVVPIVGFNGTGFGWTAQGTSVSWLGNDVLQLTADLGSENGSAFYGSPVYVGSFEASFTYQCVTGPASSADGATFCIQNDPRGAAALGGGGGDLGVGTASPITPSVEFEFNIYAGNGLGGVGVSFDQNGAIGPAVSTAPLVVNSGDYINTVITYQGGAVTVTLTDTNSSPASEYTTSESISIPGAVGANTAYVGFTAADGGSKSTQQISDFNFVSLSPTLTAQVSSGNLLLSWPNGVGAYILEQTPVLGTSANWTPVSSNPILVNGQNEVSLPLSGAADSFYRLVLQIPGNF